MSLPIRSPAIIARRLSATWLIVFDSRQPNGDPAIGIAESQADPFLAQINTQNSHGVVLASVWLIAPAA